MTLPTADAVIEALGRSRHVADAAKLLGIGTRSVSNVLERAGRGAPGQYLYGVTPRASASMVPPAAYTGAPPVDLDDDETHRVDVRPTDPVPPRVEWVGSNVARASAWPLPAQPTRKLAQLSDIHIPYENHRTWDQSLRVIDDTKCDTVVINGDGIDCYPLSFFSKDPTRHLTFLDEITKARMRLREIESISSVRRLVYIEGNHEARVPRYVSEKCPALHGMMPTVPEMLELKEHGWEWVEYRNHIQIGSARFTHEAGIGGVYAIQRTRDVFAHDMFMGHIHKAGVHWSGDGDGRIYVGGSFGCMCDMMAVNYEHRIRLLRTMVQGFGLVYFDDAGKAFPMAVPVIDGRCMAEGKIYA